MARKVIINGRIYLETDTRKVVVGGGIYKETVSAPAAAALGYFTQLPKEAHPDFATPGKKPVGEVEVDWGHPLTK